MGSYNITVELRSAIIEILPSAEKPTLVIAVADSIGGGTGGDESSGQISFARSRGSSSPLSGRGFVWGLPVESL